MSVDMLNIKNEITFLKTLTIEITEKYEKCS